MHVHTYPHRRLHSALPEQLARTALWPEERWPTSIIQRSKSHWQHSIIHASTRPGEMVSQLTFSSRAISCVLFRPLARSSRSLVPLAPELGLSSDIHWALNALSCSCNSIKKLQSANGSYFVLCVIITAGFLSRTAFELEPYKTALHG